MTKRSALQNDRNTRRRQWGALYAALALFVVFGVASAAGVAHAQTTITVTSMSDPSASGSCTLHDAITIANGGPAAAGDTCVSSGSGAPYTIKFSLSGTITLGGGLPAIMHTLTIDGAGQTVAISGANAYGVLTVDSGATVALDNLTIENGSSPTVGFGGILNNGTLTVTNSTFSGNSVSGFGDGGGIYNLGTLTVTNSTFSANSGSYGGGIGNIGGTATVSNSTFSANSAGYGAGGGIFNDGTLTVTNSTFSGNSAGDGGGIYIFNGTATVSNTILADNSGGNCADTITDGGYNISDDGSCNFSATTGSSNNTNPDLSASGLANNGGPTETIALDSDSPAIDKIPVKVCPATDQRGYLRPDDAAESVCDIGAYESGAMPALTLTDLKLDLAPATGGFDLKTNLTVAGGRTLDPSTQPVTLQIGTYSVTIPAGSFLVRGKKKAYVFAGTIDGVALQFRIDPTGGGTYILQAEGAGANLSGIANPVTVTVTIGNYSGSASVTADFS